MWLWLDEKRAFLTQYCKLVHHGTRPIVVAAVLLSDSRSQLIPQLHTGNCSSDHKLAPITPFSAIIPPRPLVNVHITQHSYWIIAGRIAQSVTYYALASFPAPFEYIRLLCGDWRGPAVWLCSPQTRLCAVVEEAANCTARCSFITHTPTPLASIWRAEHTCGLGICPVKP